MKPMKPLGRSLGAPALFGIVQGFIAASVYFAVGLVAQRALGFSWLVFLTGGLVFACVVLSYVEGASLHQERGGATVIARFAFNELVSFIAGWAICLEYIILIAICAFGTTDYAAVFWDGFDAGLPEFALAAGLVVFVAFWNSRGSAAPTYEWGVLVVLADLALQLLIVAFGVAYLVEPEVLTDPASVAGTPSLKDLLFAFPLVLVAFSGLDASSGLAGQVRIGRRGLRRLISVRLLAALVPYVGIAIVASATLPREPGTTWLEAPLLGVVQAFSQDWLREPLRYVVAVSAVAILAGGCSAAMLGVSRLGYSLALNRQIPSRIGYLHPQRATPVVIIGIGAALALLLLLTADLEFLLGISAFGATAAFTLVCLSVCRLRWREPDRDRPYRMPFNVRVGGGELPVPAALGALISGAAFVSVLAFHGGARWVGLGWMAFGVLVYVYYRLSEDKPLLKRITVPEQVLTRKRAEAEYGSILVPVLGTLLDDDIVQTAGRLAAEEDAEFAEGGAVIEALWVFEVPMALPLDSPVPESELKRARRALARAKAVGEEYQGVEVATAVVRARRAGEAIVREAKRRGVEAIVLAAEQPVRTGGGVLFGGKEGLRDTYVGETTRYVVTKAPCRVVLTAPPAEGQDPTRVAEEPVEVPSGHVPVPEA
ncbi:MAG TPA: amino acid permease [Solirubrobacteraceae bacterium]|jgi:basic amino acid/polyamine antiporter, APA family|nr:amino acid permease [Solirubrobacteraceae bacterium]